VLTTALAQFNEGFNHDFVFCGVFWVFLSCIAIYYIDRLTVLVYTASRPSVGERFSMLSSKRWRIKANTMIKINRQDKRRLNNKQTNWTKLNWTTWTKLEIILLSFHCRLFTYTTTALTLFRPVCRYFTSVNPNRTMSNNSVRYWYKVKHICHEEMMITEGILKLSWNIRDNNYFNCHWNYLINYHEEKYNTLNLILDPLWGRKQWHIQDIDLKDQITAGLLDWSVLLCADWSHLNWSSQTLWNKTTQLKKCFFGLCFWLIWCLSALHTKLQLRSKTLIDVE